VQPLAVPEVTAWRKIVFGIAKVGLDADIWLMPTQPPRPAAKQVPKHPLSLDQLPAECPGVRECRGTSHDDCTLKQCIVTFPLRRTPYSQLPEVPAGTIIDVQPNAAMSVGPAFEIIHDQNWLLSRADKKLRGCVLDLDAHSRPFARDQVDVRLVSRWSFAA
jgi:hypothetical protein